MAEVVNGRLVKYYYAGSILVSKKETDKTLWYHTDHLSSTRFMTDSAGQIVNSYDYSVYGSIISSSELMENDVNFTGHKNDPETGLIYMKSRYYDASLCRFISADTMGVRLINPQTMNRYSYVVNDPVNFLDPDGHELESVFSSNNDWENMDSYDSLQYILDMPMDSSSDLIGDYNTLDTSYNPQMNGYVLNDPVNFVDPWGLLTTNSGVSLTASLLGATLDINISYVEDDQGDSGVALSLGGGGNTEVAGVSVMGSGGATNATSINDLRGASATVGAGGGQVIGGTVEGVLGGSYQGLNTNAGFTLGIIPVDMYGFASKTYVFNFNDAIDKIKKLFGPRGMDQLGNPCE